MQFDLKKITEIRGQFLEISGNFWLRSYKFVLVFFLMTAIFYGSYVWNRSLNGGKWTEEKKQEYLKAQDTGVALNETDFKTALEDVEARKRESITDNRNQKKDIFKEY